MTETRRRLAGLAVPALAFVAIAVVLHLVIWQAAEHLPAQEAARDCVKGEQPPSSPCGRPRTTTGDDVLGPWLWYDSGWYVDIAEHGYSAPQVAAFKNGTQSAVAFFPAYPLVVRAADVAVNDAAVSAMGVTLLCGLAATMLFWLWCANRLSSRARLIALALFLLYPYSWFMYGTGYADALFVCFALGAFVVLDRGHPIVAGLLGAVATAARPTGAAVLIGLVAVALDRSEAVTWEGGFRWRFDRSKLRPSDAGVLLAASGLLAWMGFLWAKTGDAVAFLTVQAAPGWNQGAGFDTWSKRAFFGHLIHGSPSFSIRLVAQALAVALFLVAIPVVARRVGWGYAAFSLAMIGIPLIGTGDFQGMGRYLCGVFPVFAVGGTLLDDRPRATVAVVSASAIGLLSMSALFASGLYLT